ncbi:hypothetical protein TWF594_009044 [Orbilia oligospora]|nr:hypothetical protein TWF706_004021 [Orbilia oligospora]KAF3133578.1 hypothetical protein TWF594_009044 [Orbilia oligospora]
MRPRLETEPLTWAFDVSSGVTCTKKLHKQDEIPPRQQNSPNLYNFKIYYIRLYRAVTGSHLSSELHLASQVEQKWSINEPSIKRKHREEKSVGVQRLSAF